jgi:small multidrug resistance family-3 protein
MRNIHPLVFILIATTLEVNGNALVRLGVYNHAGLLRLYHLAGGAVLLFGYGLAVNLAPLEFGQVVGLYIATLFVIWQVITFIVFRSVPDIPIVVGGVLIIVGGLIVTFWRPAVS